MHIYIYYLPSDILFGILFGVLSGIVSDILFCILPGIISGIRVHCDMVQPGPGLIALSLKSRDLHLAGQEIVCFLGVIVTLPHWKLT